MITKNRVAFFSVLGLASLLVPAVVLAATLRPGTTVRQNNDGKLNNIQNSSASASVCGRIDAFMEKLKLNLGQANTHLAKIRAEKLPHLQNRVKQNDEQLDKIRKNAENNRKQFYEILRLRAQTEEQKQAVEKFRLAVEATVQTRQQAIDEANKAYRQGVEQLNSTRQQALDQALKTFQASIQAAMDKAKTDCQTTDTATGRTQLLADLQKAREQLRTATQTANQVQNTLQQLKQTRRQAIEKAFKDFKTAFQTALADLKAALPNATSNNTPPKTDD
jgi:chromosome segregation ATPase